MSSYKQKFNKLYNQSLNSSNSKSNISKLTGIPVNKLNELFDNVMKYPATNGYLDLDKKIPKGAFAMSQVYKYAIQNRRK